MSVQVLAQPFDRKGELKHFITQLLFVSTCRYNDTMKENISVNSLVELTQGKKDLEDHQHTLTNLRLFFMRLTLQTIPTSKVITL